MSARFRVLDLDPGRESGTVLIDPFAAAFRTTRMPMVFTDPRQPDNPIAFANAAFLGLTGYGLEEVVGRNCRFLQGPGTDPDIVGRIRNSMAAREGIEVEILNYRKDGSEFWNALVISPVHDEAGSLVYFFASQSDVSDKKRVEFELSRSKAQLEGEVARRTADLKAALDRQTMLLHELDHRVKNNLQTVQSLTLMQARRSSGEEARGVLLAMGDRLNALSTVHRLLYPADDASRFDFAEFMDDLTGDLLAGQPEGRFALALDIEQPISLAAAKATPLALLVNELLGQSLQDAAPDTGASRLSVTLRKPDGGLRIVIEDEGGRAGASPGSDRDFSRQLVEMLARQLHATIAVEDLPSGRCRTLFIPMSTEESRS